MKKCKISFRYECEEEVEKELYEYVSSFFDWNYRKVEEENNS